MIFISYVREISTDSANLIYDVLTSEFDERTVFKDDRSDGHEPGSRGWRGRFLRKLCDSPRAVVAIIDDGWSKELASRRTGRDASFVSNELLWAWKTDSPVFPVLMPGATWPKKTRRLAEGAARMVRGEMKVESIVDLRSADEHAMGQLALLAQKIKHEAVEQQRVADSFHRRGHPTPAESVVLSLITDVDNRLQYLADIGLNPTDIQALEEEEAVRLRIPERMSRKQRRELDKLIRKGGFSLPKDHPGHPDELGH